MEKITKNVQETYEVAKLVASKLSGGEILLLNGDLGAGKTTFTKGLAIALDVDDVITSPTFTIMKEYYGKLKLYHFDMYRLSSEDEVYELGFEEYLNDENGVAVIEWNKFSSFETSDVFTLNFSRIDDTTRRIEIDDRLIDR
ncbi:MAG: tRNA (adenosine(37)-N6)-threonylcarbamoyltransferase complex ATPase subunit type 1 TsaE [Clostridia bacterium]|nr:tRNA (adenosine(37)-N6)-threonylcarbamoyltransferase complex ATPase subunit type 1 TsaE [Clostridia bacterium]MDY5263473.1 tRNA (adenosine(37)-N6)-threonylcarbamoyltransferase complex ATPase subunit type 1 TsaE [Eubacteriales bacterium]